ncbi:hypothetical protein [Longispora urticae]
MSRMVRTVGRVAVAAAVLGGALLGATPAQADAPLSVSADCMSRSGWFYGGMDCSAWAAGGTAPYSYQWSSSSNTFISGPGQEASGGCTPDTMAWANVTVTDSAGRTASGTAMFWCNGPNPV